MRSCLLLFLVFFCKIVTCRDFYAGVFNTNDFLVAQDHLYKEKVSYRTTFAKYGRYFKCPITYFRVVDRLGMGRGPRVEVIRGGLKQREIVLRLSSPYNLPISVNVYVGCENKDAQKQFISKTTATTASKENTNVTTEKAGNETTPSGGDTTTAAGETTTAEVTTTAGETTTPEATVSTTNSTPPTVPSK